MKEKFNYLDYDSAMEYVGFSDEIYKIVLDTYVSDERTEQLAEAFAAQDWDNYRILAHGVKSTSKTIGANELSELAKTMEFAVKDNTIDVILDGHAAFLEAYKNMVQRISDDLASMED